MRSTPAAWVRHGGLAGTARGWLWPTALAVAASLVVGHLAAFLLSRGLTSLEAVYRGFPATALALATISTVAAAWQAQARRSRLARPWTLLACGYVAFTVAEAAGAAFGVTFQTVGWAKLLASLYLLFYPLFLLGVLDLPAADQPAGERAGLVLDIAMVVIAVGLVLWVQVLQPTLEAGAADPFVVMITVGCALGDLAILWAALTLVFRRYPQPAAPVYGLLAASAGILIIADVAWAYRALSQQAGPSLFLGVGWTASHALAGLAAVRQIVIAGVEAKAPPVGTGHERPSYASVGLAYLCLAVAWGAVVARHFQYVSPVAALATLLLIGVIAARHRVGILRNAALHGRLEEARIRLEELVSERTAELRASEERFRRLSEAAFEGIGITENGVIVDANDRLGEMFGYRASELVGRHVMELVAPEAVPMVQDFMRRPRDERCEHLAIRRDGTVFPVETQGKAISTPGGSLRVATVRDVTERRLWEEHLKRQLERLATLRAIDAAITSSLDLRYGMDVLVDLSLRQLKADAEAVLTFERGEGRLTFLTGQGFRTDAVSAARLELWELHDGPKAPEGWALSVDDLNALEAGCPRRALMEAEAFRSYHAAPLVARDQVCGVLEVYGRDPFTPDQEWLDFFETVAGQAAVAIDNLSLFESTQRSYVELARTYDTTLEGWSHALELRDRETQGHATRVVDMTVRLAQALGVGEADLVHVRRGALLHDIGKMGIPDAILLKPGALTPEEWQIMRRHPQLAADLLTPIAFLRPALDIPFCHHEHWDGSGYPRGLKGEEIPLAARMFAVVDAWDGLRNARPYREAWPPERVREHLRMEAGRSFDPVVVAAFLELVAQPGPRIGVASGV